MASIRDFTDTEEWIIRTMLKKRYRHDMELQFADSDIRLHASGRERTSCPVIFRQTDFASRQKGDLPAR